MSNVKASFSESSLITTFLRTNLPKSRSRTKLATFGKKEKLHHTPQIAEEKAVSTTGISKNLSTEVEVACASAKPIKDFFTFSRKPVPQQFLDRLVDMRTIFTVPLLDTVSAKQRPTKGVSLKLKYRDQSDNLYLVVQCDERDKKTMENFFAQSHVREIVGDDITIYVTTGLRQLATKKFKVYSATIRIASAGTRIRIEGPHGSSMATLGGVIVVTKEGRSVLHGLTAGHVLTRLVRNPDRLLRSCLSAIEDDSDTPYNIDEPSDYSDDDRSEVILGAHYDQTSRASPASGSHIGSITEHSFQSKSSSTNYDWALIELHPDQSFPNLIHISHHSEFDKQVNSTPLAFKLLVSTSIQSQVNVVIPTSRGNQRGTLTSSTSSFLVAPGREFVETHDVVLDDGFSLQPGDSGSWVIHETTGEVYGHVVSIDMFGEVYVMPFNHTLRDIEAHLDADHVGLPENFETTLPRPIEVTSTASGIEGLPMGPHHDFAKPQIHNISPPKGPLQYLGIGGSPAYVDSEIGEKNHKQPDQCDEYFEGFHGPNELQRHKEVRHQRGTIVFICVPPAPEALEVKIRTIYPVEACSACKRVKKYDSFSSAAVHLCRKHYLGRPLQPKTNPTTVATSERDPRNWPPIQEVVSWIKKVRVNGVDSNSLDSEEDSDAIMEKEYWDQYAGGNTHDENSQVEAGRLTESMKSMRFRPLPIHFDRRVNFLSSSSSSRSRKQVRRVRAANQVILLWKDLHLDKGVKLSALGRDFD
ncbi:hypothetical protein F4680DRAFT_465104 [Xylaria scruposa]|nr:hypothetical protein F4680DRAFT_465104 [Xylaria scruposa]